jgi:excinuclease UvrABC nuclease subunit
MAVQLFNQRFEGMWRESNKCEIPNKSGIYCVYECKYNSDKRMISILKLLYIGESNNVNERISNHEKQKEWEECVHAGNQLCYCFSSTSPDDRERVEAAFIYRHQPPVNNSCKDCFPFDKTRVRLAGIFSHLDSFFVVSTPKEEERN